MADDVFPHDPEVVSSEKRLRDLRSGTGVNRSLQDVLSSYPEEEATEFEESIIQEDDRVVSVVEPPPRLPTTINLFQHPDAHPFVLDLALLKKYGPEWMQWEHEVLELRILNDFRTNSLSDLNADKIMAVASLHMRDEFWKEWQVFTPCALALSGYSPDFEVMSSVTVPQALIAVDIANKLRGDVKWSDEMNAFLGIIHMHDGMFCPIPPLDFVEIDSEDYPVDCAEIRERWDEVRAARRAPEPTTVENEQLRRMLEAWELLEESRRQIQDQLPLIYHGRD